MTASPPAVTPVAQQTAREFRDMLGKHQVALEADADPERDADNQAVSVVDPVLDGHLHADGEERRQQHAEIGREHGTRYRQHHGEHLGQERDRDEYRPGRDPAATRPAS